MSTTILTLWAALLVAVLVLLPFIVAGLHRIWRASRNIDRYMGEMLAAAQGIAGNTVEIRQLDATIDTATRLLETAGGIHDKAGTIRVTLAGRAATGSE